MKTSSLKICALGLCAGALSINGAITGHWDFDSDLSAQIGQPIDYLDPDTQAQAQFGTAASFGIPNIGGQETRVMKFPKSPDSGGFLVPSGASANGGGFLVNQFTVIMDVYYPAASSGKERALIDSDQFGNSDYRINAGNGIGVAGGPFDGTVTADTWHRIIFAADYSANPPVVTKFVNGVKVGTQNIGSLDSNLGLSDYFYLFSDDNGETEAGYINSLQVRDEMIPDGFAAELGGPQSGGILVGPPPNPWFVAISPVSEPIPERSTVSPLPEIRVVLENGVTGVNRSTVVLMLDNVAVPATVTPDGERTIVTYTPTAFLAPLSAHDVSISFQNDATTPQTITRQWKFVVGQFQALPESAALPALSGNTPGFRVRMAQAPMGTEIPNVYTFSRAILQLNGLLEDAAGELIPNVAVAGANSDGSHSVEGTLNYELNGGTFGNFEGDQSFPGVPGLDGGTDNFATEVLTFLELPQGLSRLGVSVSADRTDTGTDDGFTLYTGADPRNFVSHIIGVYARGNISPFASTHNNNEFTVFAPKAGIYPIRLVHYQTGQNASLEFYTVDLATGEKVLINDSANPKAIKAFQVSTAAASGKPYVANIAPRPGGSGFSPLLPIEVLLIDDVTTVDRNSVKLSLNGAVVPATVQQSGGRTTVFYQPNATRTDVNNQLKLEYKDNLGNSFQSEWEFTITVNTSAVSNVSGQWDFDQGSLSATVGAPLEFLDGESGQTATKTLFGTTTSFGIPDINGVPANVMYVPGDRNNQIGYIMRHGIPANGGGNRVNQYTLIMDVYWEPGPGFASIINYDLANTSDGDFFFRVGDGGFGQGGGGYEGNTRMEVGKWHRVVFAVDMGANPPVVTKYLDGMKHADQTQPNNTLDGDRRTLPVQGAVLFGDGDDGERHPAYVNSIQVRAGKLTDAEIAALGAASASGIPSQIGPTSVKGQWDFNLGNLAPTVGAPLEYLDGQGGQTETKTQFGTTASFGIPDIDGNPASVMHIPGDRNNQIGYIMRHGIAANGGGNRVNQYTLIMDVYWEAGPGFASIINYDLANSSDGDLFFRVADGGFGQGGGGYEGNARMEVGKWHRVAFAVDMAANPPVVTKYLDGIKHADQTQPNNTLDGDRRTLPLLGAVLFGDGDDGERHPAFVSSIQVREGKLTDAELALLGKPTASGIPLVLPKPSVAGHWDFDSGSLVATVGNNLEYLDGDAGQTATKTQFGTTASFGIPAIDGEVANVMYVPGDRNNQIGYIMRHGIAANGGGNRVNQYTLIMDLYWEPGPGFASFINYDLANTSDGDLFFRVGDGGFGQGGGGYEGNARMEVGKWHRVAFAVDMAANPPVVTKYLDGVKHADQTQPNNTLDGDRRTLPVDGAVLFGDGDDGERHPVYVNSVQVRAGKLSDAELALLGGPTAAGIPLVVPNPNVAGQWDFDTGNLIARVGKDLEYLDGTTGQTATKTAFGTTTSFGIPDINGEPAVVMHIPGDRNNQIGYIMRHGIPANGGGNRVNQYTLIMDLYWEPGPGFASFINYDLANTSDGDLFFRVDDGGFGQGGGGYEGATRMEVGKWHRVAFAVDMAANPPVVTKFLDGVKHADQTQPNNTLDGDRRTLPVDGAVLFGDGDDGERHPVYVNSIQLRSGKLSDAELAMLGGPSAAGIPLLISDGGTEPPLIAELTASLVQGGLRISWPTELDGYVLETSATMAPNSWTTVNGVQNNSVVIQPNAAHAFFRLRK